LAEKTASGGTTTPLAPSACESLAPCRVNVECLKRVCGPKAVVLGRGDSAAQQISGQLHADFRQVGYRLQAPQRRPSTTARIASSPDP
jgi:hypothetical protein